jgi:outer membrane immunogenic protein
VNGGWGWGQQDPLNLIASRFDRDSFNINGGMIGGTFGAQIQQGAIVLGFETDLDWADISGSRTTIPAIAGIPIGGVFNFNTKWEALGTARARAGVALNNWLIYATGGAAFVKETASGTTLSGVPCGTLGIIPSCAESHWRPGLAVGAGAEWAFASNWTAKAEYLYIATKWAPGSVRITSTWFAAASTISSAPSDAGLQVSCFAGSGSGHYLQHGSPSSRARR